MKLKLCYRPETFGIPENLRSVTLTDSNGVELGEWYDEEYESSDASSILEFIQLSNFIIETEKGYE